MEAWRRLAPRDWDLLIVGPDEGGHGAEVKAAIRAANLQESVTLPGATWGKERFRRYWESDLFVLPSFSENFGLVVAEALACEVPVITTRGLPWAELQTNSCGWWTDIGVEPLVTALREAMALTDEERRAMGKRGREFIARNYAWKTAGERLSETYQWMLGRAQKPSFVETVRPH